MVWAGILDALLFIAAIVLFFMGYGIASLVCAIVAVVLLLILSSGHADLSDIFDIFD